MKIDTKTGKKTKKYTSQTFAALLLSLTALINELALNVSLEVGPKKYED